MPNDILKDDVQLKDNLTEIVKSFNKVFAKNDDARDLRTDIPKDFLDVLFDSASKFEHGVGSFSTIDPNVKFLGAMGAALLSWDIAISRAKEGDIKRKYTDQERARKIDTVYWQWKEYLDLILKEAFTIGPRLNNGKNSPIIQASEGYFPKP